MIRFDDILDEVVGRFSDKDISVLRKAYVFSAQAHKGQVRRSGEPYLSHPLEVANLLAGMKLDRTALVAGLLHDVLEDTDVTAADIKDAFGKDVAGLVEGVTKISRVQDVSPEASRAETVRKIILAMTDDLRVIFIKLADRLHNLQTLKFLPEDKQKQIAAETLEIYAPIANRLGMGRIKAELEDLAFRYQEPEEFFRIASLVEPRRKSGEAELKKFRRLLERLMKDNRIPVEVSYRIKRPYSIYRKMKSQRIEFHQVYDFLALRIITDTVKSCYAALGIIHQKWPPLLQRFRDFIAMPKPNLYQALHTTVITEDKQSFEIQIRTREMNDLAENGIAAHWKYKEEDPQALMREDKRLQWLREMVELFSEQKNPKEFLKNLKINLIPEEVYVFSPKGRVVSLPTGASALDFAFRIHTEIGLHSAQAKINGKVSPLKTLLKTGDIVEIVTSPDKTPSRGWLNFAFTSGARHQLKRWLKQQEKGRTAARGKKGRAAGRGESGLPAGALVRPARCCAPIKGEPIIGYLTVGKGITAHALRCSLIAREILVPERMVDIAWDQVAQEEFQAKLIIRSTDAPGLLADIASAVAKLDGNITKAEVETFADKKAQTRLSLTVRDIRHLEAVIQDVSRLAGVLGVERD